MTTTPAPARPEAGRGRFDPDEIRDLVRNLLADRRIPGASLVVTTAAGPVFSEGFGSADLVTARPVATDTSFLWFSLTKIATATTALALCDRGELELDRPVRAYLPWFSGSQDGIEPTVRNLLNHSAGIPDPVPVRWIHGIDADPPESLSLLRAHLPRGGGVTRPVGRTARYSNLGYLVLAEVISSTVGAPFTRVVEDVLLRPAGMDRTGFTYRVGAPAAVGYVKVPRPFGALLSAVLPRGTVDRRVGHHVALRPFYVDGAGYGGLVGDAVDASRLAQLHLADGTIHGHRILEPATARAMRTITTPGKRRDLGLGWFRSGGGSHVEHLGAGGGFFNVMRLYPDAGVGVTMMANTTSPYPHGELFDRIVALAGGGPTRP